MTLEEYVNKRFGSIDRDKLVKAMQHHLFMNDPNDGRDCNSCPYYDICKHRGFADALYQDALVLLEHEQETPEPVRDSTSDFVRFNQGEVVAIINRNYIIDAAYNPSTDETRVCMRGINALAKYKGNIVDKITGGD